MCRVFSTRQSFLAVCAALALVLPAPVLATDVAGDAAAAEASAPAGQDVVLVAAEPKAPPEADSGTEAAPAPAGDATPDEPPMLDEPQAEAAVAEENTGAASSADTYASEQEAAMQELFAEAAEQEADVGADGEEPGAAEPVELADGAGEDADSADAADAADAGPEMRNGVAYKRMDIAGLDHELTERYRRQFSVGYGRKMLVASLKNAARYRPYILQQLQEREMPLYLQYLPIVESNYIPTAVSRSGATGIWQFMENSMAPMLKKDSWYDERRDAWKSTDAALVKLADNYRFFGDWAIAIAAYNCGTGAMSRALNRNPGKTTFWELAEESLIPQQSAQYVPKLLAIADLVENATYYGLDDIAESARMPEEADVEEFDYVTTIAMLSFNQISEVTGVDKAEIKFLNQALFRNCTPARETYQLRLPKGAGEGAEEKFKAQGVAADAVIYTVIKGDTLWGISRRYGIPIADICDVNGIRESDVLSIGKRLIVPIFN